MTESGRSAAAVLRAALALQAGVTAAPVVLAAHLSTSAFLALVVAAGAVFAAVALQESTLPVLAYETVAVTVGVLCLVAGVVVPGTLVGVAVLGLLLTRRGGALLAGAVEVPLEVAGLAPPPVPEPVVAPVPVPRRASVTVLPR